MSVKKIRFFFLSASLLLFFLSCATGQYMSLKGSDNADALGIVKTTFSISGSFRYRRAINNQAYMNLLAEAQKEYPDVIDVRDITWAIGKSDTANNNYEYTAIGKVVRRAQDSAK